MIDPILFRWIASMSCIAAAIMVASDGGRRITAYGFMLFSISSACWIVAALVDDKTPLILQNAALLVINVIGVWRYFRPR